MSNRKVVTYVVAALVAGLVLGSFGIASAAGTSGSSTTSTAAPLGIRMGQTIKQAGATLADVVAKLTGSTTEAVRAERAEGKSFAQIAGEENVSADKVVSETLKARKALLDRAVKSGQITQAQADAAYDRMKTRLTQRVSDPTACTGTGSGNCGAGGGGCGMGGGGRRGGMMGGRGAGNGTCTGCTANPVTTQ